jgi:hypothetical protein
LGTDHVDVSVQDTSSDEQCFWFVLFLLMEVKDFLDTVGAVISSDLLINVLLFIECVSYFLADGHLFVAELDLVTQVVGHGEGFLQ